MDKKFLAWLCLAVAATSSASPAQATMAPERLEAIGTIATATAIQAEIFCVPVVAMYNLRYSIAFAPTAEAKPGKIWRFAQIATPQVVRRTQYVSPNVNVLYGYGFIDLRREPVILTVPDSHGRYYMVQMVDMWTNSFAYAGGAAAGYRGGRYAIVGPGWHGSLPNGVKRIDAPTRWIELQPRVFVKDRQDLAAADEVLNRIAVTGLAEYEGRPAPPAPAYRYEAPLLDPSVASSKMAFKDPSQFWSICSNAMNENPPARAIVQAELPQFKILGLKLGTQWTPKGVNPMLLQLMNDSVSRIGTFLENVAALAPKKNGWTIPPYDVGRTGADYLTGAITAVVGLTANTVREAVYYRSDVDSRGRALSGQQKYTITFSPGMPYAASLSPGFWSITMYDAASGYTIDNPIGRYALGSGDALKKNPDGSVTVYIQRDDPGGDKTSNWLPAPPGAFYLLLRDYAPAPAVYEGLKSPATFDAPPPVVP